MTTRRFLLTIVTSLLGFFLNAQNDYYFPSGTSLNSDVPSPESFLGYAVGDWHTRYDRVVSYFETLAEITDAAILDRIGNTNEMRPQIVLTISNPDNLANLEEIRQRHLQNADPRMQAPDASAMPAVILLGYNVHGNEPSSAEAAMLTAYYLLASRDEEVAEFLNNAIIMIDPCFNPDGRDRHSFWVNTNKGKVLVADPSEREHNEVWPRGRTNHYWFDLNRDWLPLAQVESRNRMAFYHRWLPNVVTDYHEMGSSSTYFFEPTEPYGSENPVVGRRNYDEFNNLFAPYFAEALDEIGSLYFTKEVYDNSYPGYGSTYPDMHGGLGLVFEQASSRGHLQETTTKPITFPFSIRNHLRTSIATIRASVENREYLLRYQREFFQESLDAGRSSDTRAYIFNDDDDAGKTRDFLNLLLQHRIEVYQLQQDLADFEAGQAYFVPADQVQNRMVRTFFEFVTSFHDSVFYDASAWTVALAFDMPFSATTQALSKSQPISEVAATEYSVARAPYAYIFEWTDYYAPKTLYALLDRGVFAKVAMRPFSIETNEGIRQFSSGSILIATADQNLNANELHRIIQDASDKGNIPIYTVATGMSMQGIDLGSRNFETIEKPRIAMVVGGSASGYETGEVWHLLDTRFDIPVTKVDASDFSGFDLDDYNTLVLCSGNYNAFSEKVKEWVEKGNTLITIRSATSWAIRSEIGELEFADSESDENENLRRDYMTAREVSGARQIGGSVYQADLDITHPLGFGYSDRSITCYRNHRIFLKPSENPYSTVIQYTEDPLLDGYLHPDNLERVRNSPSLLVDRVSRGRWIAFVDNPNFRGFWYSTNKLFMNALFFGRTF